MIYIKFVKKVNLGISYMKRIFTFWEPNDEIPGYEMQREKGWKFYSNQPFGKDKELYKKFYFENDYSDYILQNTKGIVLLHNSRVPDEYRGMSEEEFLNTNNTKSNLFKKILLQEVRKSG